MDIPMNRKFKEIHFREKDKANYVFVTSGSNPEEGIIEADIIQFKSWIKLLAQIYGYHSIHETRFNECKSYAQKHGLNVTDEQISKFVVYENINNVRYANLVISLLEIPSIKTGFLTEIAAYDAVSKLPTRIPVIALIPESKTHNHQQGSAYVIEYSDGTKEVKYTNRGRNISLMYDGIVDKYIYYNDRLIVDSSEERSLVIFSALQQLNRVLADLPHSSTILHRFSSTISSMNAYILIDEFLQFLKNTQLTLDEDNIKMIKSFINEEKRTELKSAISKIYEYLIANQIIESPLSKLISGKEIVKKLDYWQNVDIDNESMGYIQEILEFNKKYERNMNAFIIGSITNVKEHDFGNHLDLKMNIVNMLYEKFGINASFALLDNEAGLSNFSKELMPYVCYLIDQYSVENAGLLITLYGDSLGTGLELARAFITKTPVILVHAKEEQEKIPHLITGLSNIIATISYSQEYTNKQIIEELEKVVTSLRENNYINRVDKKPSIRIPSSSKIKIKIDQKLTEIINDSFSEQFTNLAKKQILKSIRFKKTKPNLNQIVKKVYYLKQP